MFDVKRGVAEKMYELVLEKDFNQITVTELINASKISRSTFYRHFNDKYDVMFYYYSMEVDNLITKEMRSWEESLFFIFNFIQYRRKFFTRVFNLDGPNSFINFLYQYSFEFYEIEFRNFYKKKLNKRDRYILEYICAGSVELVKQWIKNGYKESAESMASLTFELLPQHIKNIFIHDA
ncbi:MAG TPA: TetR-like C-terminal domain-containing protein [Erysipelothrix sp.]|nr:TetR-like C-terminal domain-containing protein [Erysipelothrix sp.]